MQNKFLPNRDNHYSKAEVSSLILYWKFSYLITQQQDPLHEQRHSFQIKAPELGQPGSRKRPKYTCRKCMAKQGRRIDSKARCRSAYIKGIVRIMICEFSGPGDKSPLFAPTKMDQIQWQPVGTQNDVNKISFKSPISFQVL